MSLPIKGVMCIAAFSPSGIAKIEKNEQTRSPSVDFFCKIMKNSVLNSLIDAIMLSCFIFDMFFSCFVVQGVSKMCPKLSCNRDTHPKCGGITCFFLMELLAICIIIQNRNKKFTVWNEIMPRFFVPSR